MIAGIVIGVAFGAVELFLYPEERGKRFGAYAVVGLVAWALL